MFERKGALMESIISNLVAQFEKGSLSRRDLVAGLAILAATGTGARAAEADIDTSRSGCRASQKKPPRAT
jgi:hypothetical protein